MPAHIFQPEATYRDYTSQQAQDYIRARGGYPDELIQHIIQAHSASGGQFSRLLDIGCGPGNCTRQFAAHFEDAVGIDPSEQMIATARTAQQEDNPTKITFHSGEAENCAEIVGAGSVDLLIAATAAHWFDMDRFWPSAAKVVKPGGTVAVFVIWRAFAHPRNPHAEEVHRVIRKLEQDTLREYEKQGNWSVMGLYEDLGMPWDLKPPCAAFPRDEASRRVWNADGRLEDGRFMCGDREMTVDEVAGMIGSSSAVTRWREAHPTLANGPKDCVVQAIAELREVLGPNTETLTMVGPTALILLKRR